MIAKPFTPRKGAKPFVIMVDARNVSMLDSGITGHNGIGSRRGVARAKAAKRLPGLEVARLLRLRQVVLLRSGLAGGPAAVGEDGLAGDQRGGRGGQEYHHAGYFDGLADAVQGGDALDDVRAELRVR
jgi:hypothetical protein